MEFLRFFNEVVRSYPMHLELGYTKTTNWMIHVWRKGTDDNGKDETILTLQDWDLEYLLAKAQIRLKDWLSDNKGGY